MKRLICALATTMAVALAVAAPAVAHDEAPQMSLTPTEGPVGTEIVVTITDCFDDGFVSPVLELVFVGVREPANVAPVDNTNPATTATITVRDIEGVTERLTEAEVVLRDCGDQSTVFRPFTVVREGPQRPPPAQPTGAVCANRTASYDPFTDDDVTTFEAVIECMARSGITAGGPAGLPDDQYGPALVVTRAQMASFIAREIDTANGVETGAGVAELAPFDGTNDFTDVAADDVHLESINRLAQAGITGGGPEGRPTSEFGPGLAVTRAQMASFVNRGHELITGTALATTADYFSDDDASAHEANINGIASEGIAVGDGVAAFGAEADVTRAQMAAFIVRHLAVLEEAGYITPLP